MIRLNLFYLLYFFCGYPVNFFILFVLRLRLTRQLFSVFSSFFSYILKVFRSYIKLFMVLIFKYFISIYYRKMFISSNLKKQKTISNKKNQRGDIRKNLENKDRESKLKKGKEASREEFKEMLLRMVASGSCKMEQVSGIMSDYDEDIKSREVNKNNLVLGKDGAGKIIICEDIKEKFLEAKKDLLRNGGFILLEDTFLLSNPLSGVERFYFYFFFNPEIFYTTVFIKNFVLYKKYVSCTGVEVQSPMGLKDLDVKYTYYNLSYGYDLFFVRFYQIMLWSLRVRSDTQKDITKLNICLYNSGFVSKFIFDRYLFLVYNPNWNGRMCFNVHIKDWGKGLKSSITRYSINFKCKAPSVFDSKFGFDEDFVYIFTSLLKFLGVNSQIPGNNPGVIIFRFLIDILFLKGYNKELILSLVLDCCNWIPYKDDFLLFNSFINYLNLNFSEYHKQFNLGDFISFFNFYFTLSIILIITHNHKCNSNVTYFNSFEDEDVIIIKKFMFKKDLNFSYLYSSFNYFNNINNDALKYISFLKNESLLISLYGRVGVTDNNLFFLDFKTTNCFSSFSSFLGLFNLCVLRRGTTSYIKSFLIILLNSFNYLIWLNTQVEGCYILNKTQITNRYLHIIKFKTKAKKGEEFKKYTKDNRNTFLDLSFDERTSFGFKSVRKPGKYNFSVCNTNLSSFIFFIMITSSKFDGQTLENNFKLTNSGDGFSGFLFFYGENLYFKVFNIIPKGNKEFFISNLRFVFDNYFFNDNYLSFNFLVYIFTPFSNGNSPCFFFINFHNNNFLFKYDIITKKWSIIEEDFTYKQSSILDSHYLVNIIYNLVNIFNSNNIHFDENVVLSSFKFTLSNFNLITNPKLLMELLGRDPICIYFFIYLTLVYFFELNLDLYCWASFNIKSNYYKGIIYFVEGVLFEYICYIKSNKGFYLDNKIIIDSIFDFFCNFLILISREINLNNLLRVSTNDDVSEDGKVIGMLETPKEDLLYQDCFKTEDIDLPNYYKMCRESLPKTFEDLDSKLDYRVSGNKFFNAYNNNYESINIEKLVEDSEFDGIFLDIKKDK